MSVDWTALDRGAAALDGSAGLIALDAGGTVLYERAADEAYPAASVIKIPILMTVFADSADGRLSLDERLAVGQHLPGSGVLGRVPGVADLTIRDHAMLMTIVSDNTATNRLMERVGVERIAERMGEWGCVRTQLRRKMFDFEAANRGLDNIAAPREMASLLLRLVRGELVDRATSDAVLAVLEATQDDALIRRYLPDRTRVAHKTGSLEKVRNDAAVIWAEQPIVAVGFVNGVPDIRPARSLLGLLGWLAYGAAGGEAKGLPSEWPEAR
ncbi:MAG: class A beta-lactamase-related serine hydrolase [Chloroflexota bacterium]|nr:class A beta-lactamase-related serine hydrolase [Chloroflexota bacterium]